MSLFASTFRVRDVCASAKCYECKVDHFRTDPQLPEIVIDIRIDVTTISRRSLQGFDAVGCERESKWSAAALRVNTCPAASVSSRIN